MRPDAAEENSVAIVQQVLRRDGGGDAGPGACHKFDGTLGGDVFKHHGQLRKALEQGCEHRIDEMSFTIEDVDVGLRRFAVYQQAHADLLHALEYAVELLYIRYS